MARAARCGGVAIIPPAHGSCGHWPASILPAAITAWVRLSTPSFCKIAETCALTVASDTPSRRRSACSAIRSTASSARGPVRRQRRKPRDRGRGFGVGVAGEIDIRRRPHFTLQHAPDRLAHRSMPSVLGIKPDAPNSMQRRITAGSSLAETTTIGRLGILRSQIHQTGKSTHAGHAEIEQDQITSRLPPRGLADIFEAAGFGDVNLFEHANDRLAQRAAEQRMVVGDQ